MKLNTLVLLSLCFAITTGFCQNELPTDSTSLFSGSGKCEQCHLRQGNILAEDNVDISPITH